MCAKYFIYMKKMLKSVNQIAQFLNKKFKVLTVLKTKESEMTRTKFFK